MDFEILLDQSLISARRTWLQSSQRCGKSVRRHNISVWGIRAVTQYICHFHNDLDRAVNTTCSAGGGRRNLLICVKKGNIQHIILAVTHLQSEKQAIILKDVQTADTQTYRTRPLIKAAQQHVTALVSPLHLFRAVPPLMSSPNVTFATTGVVNAILPRCQCVLPAPAAGLRSETAHKVHGWIIDSALDGSRGGSEDEEVEVEGKCQQMITTLTSACEGLLAAE